MPSSGKTQRTIVWAVVALFGFTLGAIVALVALTDEASLYVPMVLSAATPTIAVLAAMRAIESVKADTHALTNGLLDAKVRAGVAEVVHDELVDPAYSGGVKAADDATVADHQSPPGDRETSP